MLSAAVLLCCLAARAVAEKAQPDQTVTAEPAQYPYVVGVIAAPQGNLSSSSVNLVMPKSRSANEMESKNATSDSNCTNTTPVPGETSVGTEPPVPGVTTVPGMTTVPGVTSVPGTTSVPGATSDPHGTDSDDDFYWSMSHAKTCAGAIVKDNTIVTACHCVADKLRDRLKYRPANGSFVVAGTADPFNASSAVQVRPVQMFRCSANYNSTGVQDWGELNTHDAAVVVLKTALVFGDAVKAAVVFNLAADAAAAEFDKLAELRHECVAPGYGGESRALGVADMRLINSPYCETAACLAARGFCGLNLTESGVSCAFTVGPAFLCGGVPGSPLVCDGYLYGVLSVPFGCESNVTGFFADVRSVLNVLRALEDEQKANRIEVLPATSRPAANAEVFSVMPLIVLLLSIGRHF